MSVYIYIYVFMSKSICINTYKTYMHIYIYACKCNIWSILTTMVLFTRFMIKRAQGRKRFGMKNFKKRWFRLTNHEFTYQKSKGNKGLPGFFKKKTYIKVKIKYEDNIRTEH